MNIKRMRTLLTLLEEVQAGAWKPTDTGQYLFRETELPDSVGFNMDVWKTAGPHCQACAAGHAAMDDRFPGLYVKAGMPTSGLKRGFPALCQYFQLSSEQAYVLFSSLHYHTRSRAGDVRIQDVIKRVRAAINDEETRHETH